MKTSSLRIGASLLASAFLAEVASADPAAPPPPPTRVSFAIEDRALFPPELYPDLGSHTNDEIFLAGLAAVYRGRVVRKPPAAKLAAKIPPRNAMSVKLSNDIEYIRCYAGGKVPEPKERARIIDLRCFKADIQSVAECTQLLERLIGATPRVSAQGDYPLGAVVLPSAAALSPQQPGPAQNTPATALCVILVNKGTSGPIEAMLADLQSAGKVILVGSVTAGDTANYTPFKEYPSWLRIAGELQSASSTQSFVGKGVEPRVSVNIGFEKDLGAWLRVENGVSPETALGLAQTRRGANGNNNDGLTDMVLRRGYDILVALQGMDADALPNRGRKP
ncbi:MAG: hypothetical protein LBD01_04150 [Puniceicoccales bacterium]|jgi:hypothetical protein|nr:hypothetical protein [Puniceicoccales bacterium]